MLRFVSAGESHGQALIAWISGLPLGVPVDTDFIQRELHRGSLAMDAGAGNESRRTRRIFSPACATARRLAHPSQFALRTAIGRIGKKRCRWRIRRAQIQPAGEKGAQRPLTAPRPGHADLAGALKFNLHDARYILERASARETASRVAAGAFAKLLLHQFGATVLSHTIAVGHARLERDVSGRKLRLSATIWTRRSAALMRDRSADESRGGPCAPCGRFGGWSF